MRKMAIGIIGAALLALAAAACSSGNGATTAPSQAGLDTVDNGSMSPYSACTNCVFTAAAISGVTWTGTTTATSTPSNGHHGTLSVTFSPSLLVGATLTWSGFNTGAKASCTITASPADSDFTNPKTVSCEDGGTFVVHPQVSTTYTFTDTKNDQPSQDASQVKTLIVNVDTTREFSATWKSDMGVGDDDPGVNYNGTATGPLTALVVTATSPTRCGLGGNGPANTFNAVMNVVDTTHITGTYSGVDCTVDTGTFSLSR